MTGSQDHGRARPTGSSFRRRSSRRGSSRRGLGLLEVIVCTALVAVMIVPIAAVIRTSGQAIARADGSTSTEAKLRGGLRWLGDAIRDGDVLTIRAERLQVRLNSGNVATVEVRGGTLWLDDGSSRMPLVEDVRDIRFTPRTLTAPPNAAIGVSMTLRARDPVTRSWVSVQSTIALPPQA